jgi:hypothetical protein
VESETGTSRPKTTEASLESGRWLVGESYVVHDAIDRPGAPPDAWLPLSGRPSRKVQQRDGSWVWYEHDWRGQPVLVPDEDRKLQPGEVRVRLIVDETPDTRTRKPVVWVPSERSGLADELVRLGRGEEETIVGWVREHGFIGVRANPREWFESVEEIRHALSWLAQARDLMAAIRDLRGEALRRETERLIGLPAGELTKVKDDPSQEMSGKVLASRFGIAVPDGERWPSAGPYVQALDGLRGALQAPLYRLLRVQATIAPTGDGMRLGGAIAAQGPLATAFYQILNEASWPAITWAGSMLRLDWHAQRRCHRCGNVFRPKRRDQKWCGERCRWAASKAGQNS